ncbi:asparagine synthase (glutamine-hydrolyzing) [Ligilactobacillus agilis]|uniref:asparagine synthase (glutamine-hydrolyzing) n=1 Tax=Ligilactobacillus agilis TaxID=1601 RepID=UPI0022E8E9A0|nr:asparagine synthase (glutamine-hydrolyzing) [Ligilactobacillus agilis]
MCGFTGFISREDIDNQTVIEKMADRIKHRGPDDEGYFVDQNVSMGFRRLSIIDLAHGAQPMNVPSEQKVLTFNGEIYNFKEIRAELEGMGYNFATNVDSEVLIHGYDAWGPKLLDKLRGMFAFAIYDAKKEEVFLARDHYGIKPLYYYDDGQNFMWASEIKAFLENPHFKKEFNEELLPIYLSFEYISSKDTLFKHVYKVMPGQYLIHKISGETTKQQYFKFTYDINSEKTVPTSAKEIKELVDESVKAHMIADVEVGSFLSSGVDSSFVLNEASKLKDIQSFSLGFKNSNISELDWSSAFAKEIKQKNTPVYMDKDDFFKAVPSVMYYMDEPLPNPSAVQLYYLSKETSKHVKVALSGEGADEFFGGYNTYLEAIPYGRYERLVPLTIRKSLAKWAEKRKPFHGRRFLVRGAQPLNERYYRLNFAFNESERNKIMKHPERNMDAGQYTKHIFDQVKDLDQISQMQYFDINAWLPFDILQKADRMSMANSLELRTPLVDYKVGQYAASLPVNCRINKNETKTALRTAAVGELPPKVAKREKLGFPSPLALWMKDEQYQKEIRTAFNSDIAKKFFNTDALNEMFDSHLNGHSIMEKIYMIYAFIMWYGVFFAEDTQMDIASRVKI